jgi:hypothetical protein
MGTFRSPNIDYHANNAETGVYFSPLPILRWGLNLPVTISPANVYSKILSATPAGSIIVLAHFDTGARTTAIDIGLAEYLNLVQIGSSRVMTAGGPIDSSAFMIDLQFPGSTLAPLVNLPINSCRLNFDITNNLYSSQNFGILLGRDVMSHWNIVWNGPTSTVIIND